MNNYMGSIVWFYHVFLQITEPVKEKEEDEKEEKKETEKKEPLIKPRNFLEESDDSDEEAEVSVCLIIKPCNFLDSEEEAEVSVCLIIKPRNFLDQSDDSDEEAGVIVCLIISTFDYSV